MVVEIPPEGWGSNMLPERRASVKAGLQELRDVMGPELSNTGWSRLESAASLSGLVLDEKRTLSPAAVASSVRFAMRVRRLAPDVVHLNGDSLRFAYGTPLLRNTPLVLSLHDAVLHSGEDQGWRSRLALSRRSLLRSTSCLMTHNRQLRDGFMLSKARDRKIPVRCVLMGPYGVYRDLVEGDGSPVARDRVLFLGRLSPYKGLDTFVAAADLASQHLRDMSFAVIGKPIPGYVPPRPLALANGCRFEVDARHLSNREVADAVVQSLFVVLPYKDATQSGVLLTAYGLGRPVVATKVGGLSDYVRDDNTGRLVVSDDPIALAQVLVELCSSPDKVNRLQAGVSNLDSTPLSWSNAAEGFLDVYLEAISRGKRATLGLSEP